MTSNDRESAPETGDVGVLEIDDSILKDLESKYVDVACPVHGSPPAFELGPDGAVVERFCCETLLTIVRELQVATGERPAPPEEDDDDIEPV